MPIGTPSDPRMGNRRYVPGVCGTAARRRTTRAPRKWSGLTAARRRTRRSRPRHPSISRQRQRNSAGGQIRHPRDPHGADRMTSRSATRRAHKRGLVDADRLCPAEQSRAAGSWTPHAASWKRDGPSRVSRIQDGTCDRSSGGDRPRALPASVAARYDIALDHTHAPGLPPWDRCRQRAGGARLQARVRSDGAEGSRHGRTMMTALPTTAEHLDASSEQWIKRAAPRGPPAGASFPLCARP